ncbi:hypothetical protein TI39_contig5817g00012 [Zymoseptoria brevis]|uniref:RED-like N-terminal domain-containing protein n=1 Tax=Zymoseptoria brevis TaxID=1047168 RepID=A0A0F4G754_9PEZI|nr:hypothetical protein TI39_contig5817g00012 [Zymoseptoria brevis]
MNNDFFRKLVQDTPARQNDASPTEKHKAGPVSALGAKKSSLFGGMTPRPGKAPSNDEFAKQMRERHASLQPTKTKKFRASAPKGSKIADGYVDRAKARQEAQDEEDDKAERIKALEEQVRLGQLPYETFEALRDKIAGGDVSSTHLVKGLDFKLLERVRRGENVLDTDASKEEVEEEATVDVDEELERLQAQKIETAKREKIEKKGIMAPPPVAGVKRSRDEIMAELKAQRKAAAEAKAAAAPTFDDGRWKKIGQPEKPKIELDHKGREVITTVDKDGKVKKKVRKVAVENNAAVQPTGSMPDTSKAVLGADFALPQLKPEEPAEDDDEDIFAGAGTEYNPLGDMDNDDDSDEDADEDEAAVSKSIAKPASVREERESSDSAQAAPETIAKPRNYFGDKPIETDEAKDRFKGIENVLKKASQLGAATAATDENDDRDESKEEREARLAKRAKMLAQEDRDLEDMDMGFGSSRFEDEQEGGEEKKMRLSEWKGGAAGEEDGWEEDEKGGGKKKRKPKKRKGDVNNAADIFRVIEGRKAAQK